MSFALSVLNSALVNFVIKRFQWFFKMTLFSFLDNQKGKEIVLVLQNPLYNLWNHFLSLSAILLQALVCRFIKTCPVT